jgi:endoglucanase
MASGGNDIGEIDTVPKQEAYVLYGAVVGGPDKRDNFYDIRSDWPQAEVSPVLLILPSFIFPEREP